MNGVHGPAGGGPGQAVRMAKALWDGSAGGGRFPGFW